MDIFATLTKPIFKWYKWRELISINVWKVIFPLCYRNKEKSRTVKFLYLTVFLLKPREICQMQFTSQQRTEVSQLSHTETEPVKIPFYFYFSWVELEKWLWFLHKELSTSCADIRGTYQVSAILTAAWTIFLALAITIVTRHRKSLRTIKWMWDILSTGLLLGLSEKHKLNILSWLTKNKGVEENHVKSSAKKKSQYYNQRIIVGYYICPTEYTQLKSLPKTFAFFNWR